MKLFCEKLGDELLVKNTTNFWRKVKEGVSLTPCEKAPHLIGEATSDEEVLCLWKQHFGAIISSEPREYLKSEKGI